jgi:glyoxylase-like metal-dependent hydrolase (beta-lactamase superfamily II)/uncharacterized protein (DUF1015 family)
VIGSGVLDDLLAADPHNIVRLILPGPETGGPSGAAAWSLAARRLRSWLSSGVLVRDPAPALYIYEQNGPGWLQRGLIGLVAVGEPASSAILPHENVMPGPVTGRRKLMLETEANLEPILLVYNGGGDGTGGHRDTAGPTASSIVDEVASRQAPLLCATTGDGVTHRLWRVDDPASQAAIAADLATRAALIADGHHRYAAYRELREVMRGRGRGSGPWDYGLAYLVDADAYPPRLGAIHRVIPGLHDTEAARRAEAAFSMRPLPDDFGSAMASLADAGRGGHAFALAGPSGFRLLSDPDPARLDAAMPAGTSGRWRSLDAAVLQELLLAELWGMRDNERDVLISHDAREAVEMALAVSGTAVICNPVPLTAVRDVAARGERVPRKSTSFGPKPRTGLVFRTFEPLCALFRRFQGYRGLRASGGLRTFRGFQVMSIGSPLSPFVWDNIWVRDDIAMSKEEFTDSDGPDITNLGHDVFQIDTKMAGYQGITAGYLIRGSRPCLVETGTAPSAPVVAEALAALGVGPADLASVVVTHIHLDHAGGAGDIAAMYPSAEIVVHERGARHLADPSRLMASAKRVYGNALDRLFGTLAPVPAERIRSVDDAGTVDLGDGRRLDSHYSPGHAKHHVGLIDSASGDLYVGDAAGVYLPETGDLRPATPPPDFDLEVALTSLRKFRALEPARLLFSHYGPVSGVEEILDRSEEEIRIWVEGTRQARAAGLDLDHAVAMVREQTLSRYAALHEGADPAVAEKFERISGTAANVGGIWHWLDKIE